MSAQPRLCDAEIAPDQERGVLLFEKLGRVLQLHLHLSLTAFLARGTTYGAEPSAATANSRAQEN